MLKHYDGKIKALNELKGKIKPRNLIGKISLVNPLENLRLQFRRVNGLNGTANKRPTPTGKGIKRLNNRYVFLAAIAEFFHRFSASANTAPTTDIAVDNVVNVDTETTLTPREAEEIREDRVVKFRVIARLVAYARAPVIYISKILLACISRLESVPGAVANVKRKILYTILTAGASKADSVILESRDNRFTSDNEATGGSAPTENVASETEFIADEMAEPIAAEVAAVNVLRNVNNSVTAGLFSWFIPEQTGNRVKISQAFSAIQSDNRVAIDTEAESAYWANPYMDGNRLKLIFVESATQNNNRMELR